MTKCNFDNSRGLLISNPPQEYCSRAGCNNTWTHGTEPPECKNPSNEVNEFGRPVQTVNNIHIKSTKDGEFVLQLNDEYFKLDPIQMEMIASKLKLPKNVSISMG